jgi:ribosomal protein L16/L10AE
MLIRYNEIIVNGREYSKNTQKRVIKLKRRTTNIGGYREEVKSGAYFIRIFANREIRISKNTIELIGQDCVTLLSSYKFDILLLLRANKILTRKGVLVRMGGGKSKPFTSVQYLVPNTSVALIKPTPLTKDPTLVIKVLNHFVRKFPFLSYSVLP